jgi:hypothetical protein
MVINKAEWDRRTGTASSKRWVLPVGQAPKRQTTDEDYARNKGEKVLPKDGQWYVETKDGPKIIILESEVFQKIHDEWRTRKKPKRGAGRIEFVRDFLKKYDGVRKLDLDWLVKELSETRSPEPQLPGKPQSSI